MLLYVQWISIQLQFLKGTGNMPSVHSQPCCWVLSKALRMCRVYTEQPHRWVLWEQGTHSLCYSLCRLKSACWTKGSCISNTYHKFPLHETSTAEVLSLKSSTPEGKSSSLNLIDGETEVDNLSAENQNSWLTAQPPGKEHSPPFQPHRTAPFQHIPPASLAGERTQKWKYSH